MTSRTSNSLNSSPISSSKFYKNLKKIKKNHGMESSTKNYYLAFPALSGHKNLASSSTATTASAVAAPASNETTTTTLTADVDMSKEPNMNLLSWSNLMSKKNDESSVSSKLNDSSGSGGDRTKTPLSRRKRRYGKTQRKVLPKTDVQFSTKSFATAYENATFSPKKMPMVKNSSKKHQRNQYGESRTID
jgi:hypothetical protein